MQRYHRLLLRQLQKSGLLLRADDPDIHTFLSLVNNAYASFDEDRKMLERAMDISSNELLRANQRLRELLVSARAAMESKSNFLANMSHEIRTPLGGIIGLAEMLLDGELTPEQEPNVRLISSSANGLISVVNEILDLTKIDAGKVVFNSVPVDPRTLLQEILQTFQAAFTSHQLNVTLHCDDSLPERVLVDDVRLRQILTNLIGNAVKFTPAGGNIMLTATTAAVAESMVILSIAIADSGIGIPQTKLALIFEPFSQADNSVTRQYGGTGLGLSICQRLVTLMGGEITVESTEGTGSEFRIRIPVTALASTIPNVPHDPDSDETIQAGLRVLLAEDNRTNLLVALSALKKLRCEVVSTTNGKEAVDAFRSGEFDLVLMDCQMPEMSGFEATAIIRSLPNGHHIPIIALTALAIEGDRDRCLAVGMNDYLSKPFTRRSLAKALARWSGEYGARHKAK